MTEKLVLTWEQIERDTAILAEQIKLNLPALDYELVSVTRGGLFIGGLLSYYLGCKIVHTVCLESYTEDKLNANSKVRALADFLPNADPTKTYLFVDDVNDTSETYRFIKSKVKELGLMSYFGVTYHKPRTNNLLPDFFGNTIDPNAWIVFPWDKFKQ